MYRTTLTGEWWEELKLSPLLFFPRPAKQSHTYHLMIVSGQWLDLNGMKDRTTLGWNKTGYYLVSNHPVIHPITCSSHTCHDSYVWRETKSEVIIIFPNWKCVLQLIRVRPLGPSTSPGPISSVPNHGPYGLQGGPILLSCSISAWAGPYSAHGSKLRQCTTVSGVRLIYWGGSWDEWWPKSSWCIVHVLYT